MNLYTVAYIAQREGGEAGVIRIKPGIVLGTSEEDAQEQGMGGALAALPVSEGWANHQIVLGQIPSEMIIGDYLLKWQIDQ